MNYKYLNLPSVPTHLILPVEDVLKLENIFGGETNNYTIHEVQVELKDFLQAIFPDKTKFRYQTLIDEIPVHIDRGRTTAINYIINSGGDNVKTVWYEDDYTTPTYDVILETQKWCELQVDIYHNVTNLTERRFAITVV